MCVFLITIKVNAYKLSNKLYWLCIGTKWWWVTQWCNFYWTSNCDFNLLLKWQFLFCMMWCNVCYVLYLVLNYYFFVHRMLNNNMGLLISIKLVQQCIKQFGGLNICVYFLSPYKWMPMSADHENSIYKMNSMHFILVQNESFCVKKWNTYCFRHHHFAFVIVLLGESFWRVNVISLTKSSWNLSSCLYTLVNHPLQPQKCNYNGL